MAQDEMKKTPAAAEAPAEKQAEAARVNDAPPSGAAGDASWLFEEEDVTEAPDGADEDSRAAEATLEAEADSDAAGEAVDDKETPIEDAGAGDTDAGESATTETPDEMPSEAADETVQAEAETPSEDAEAIATETAAEEKADSAEAAAPSEEPAVPTDADAATGSTDAPDEALYDEETPSEDAGDGDTDTGESATAETPGEMPSEAAEPADETVEPEGEVSSEEAAATSADGETAASDAAAVANDRLREQARDLTEAPGPEAGEAESAPAEAAADDAEAAMAGDAEATEAPAAEGRTIDLGAAEAPAAPPVKKWKKGRWIAGVAIAVLAAIYLAGAAFYHGHFFAGTTINGVAAGNRSPAAVKATLQNKAATYRLVLKGKDNHVEKVTASALGIAYKGDAALQKLLTEQNSFAWPAMVFRKDRRGASVLRHDEAKVDRVISMLNLVTGDQVIDAQNARPVVESDGRVVIKDAVAGNQLDKARLKATMLKAIAAGDEHIDLEKDKCYVQPKYQKDSAAVKRAAKVMKRYAKAKITYLFGTDTEVVDSKVFGSWLTVDGSMHVTVDEAKAADYLYRLALRTNTAYGKHTFKTTGGSTITVNGGSYGWRIDRETELKRLVTDIKSANGVNREPAYKQRAKIRTSTYEDIGDSYVEISIAQQHMWVYKNGRQVVSTAVVTGNTAAGHGTTPGVYDVAYKARHATLKGEDYETPVSYWMPFNGGQGIHDSWWRGAYGGTIYRGGGSHGCVNTPPSQAAVVYANVEAGTPVIVYY